MPLEKYRGRIYACSKDAACKATFPESLGLPTCPPYERFHFDAYYAGGFMYLARKVITGEVKPSQDIAEIMYTCTTCGMCEDICANDVPVREIMEEFRFDLVKGGFAPMPALKEAAGNIANNHNPFGASHDKRFAWLAEKVPSEADVVYFVGSTTAYKTPEIAQATVKVLNTAGVKFGIVDEWDSGELLFRTGQRELAADSMKHNVDAIKSAGAKTVITSDPHDYALFKREYQMPGVEVLHTTEYINNLIKAGKLAHKIGIEDKVTYHDPCNLGRLGRGKFQGYQVVEPPREILKDLHVENTEMLRYKERTWCCGAGGGVYLHLPEYNEWTAAERLAEAEKTGAKMVVTACPLCKLNLTAAAQKAKSSIKVSDINELIVTTAC